MRARRLLPAARAELVDEIGALLQSHAFIADGATSLAWQTKFQAQMWKWGALWDPVPASMRAKKSEPLCKPPNGTTPFMAKTDDAMQRLRSDFARCFASTSSKAPGTALLMGRLAADGSVDSLRGIAIGLDVASTECMTRAFAATHFMPPPAGNTLPTVIPIPASRERPRSPRDDLPFKTLTEFDAFATTCLATPI